MRVGVNFVSRLLELVLGWEKRVRPGRRRCFVCTAPSLLLRWREKVAHFSTQLPFKTAGFWGKSRKSVSEARLGVGAGARLAATEMVSETQVHSHPTIRAKLK